MPFQPAEKWKANFMRQPVSVSHYGPGSQHGKPYYPFGQECNKGEVPWPDPRAPLSFQGTAHMQTSGGNRKGEKLLYTYPDPPTDRSVGVSFNKTGGPMDSISHTYKVGSKHMCQ